MSGTDQYRDWDGAYVLGSLSSVERAEYEQHLTTCDDCARDVAELADLSGMLSAVPAGRAMALIDAELSPPAPPPGLQLVAPADPASLRPSGRRGGPAIGGGQGAHDVPPALLPKVIELATSDQARRRRHRNTVAAAVVAAAACVALAVGLVVPRFLDDSRSPAIVLAQTVSSPITAEAQLVEEPWGTKIEVTCWYATDWSPPPGVSPGGTFAYDLYITDAAGVTTKQASWTASPGMVATPEATTQTPVDQIASIDIRVGGSDLVLLDADL